MLVDSDRQAVRQLHQNIEAVGLPGAKNAGLLAAQILALSDPDLAERLAAWREHLTRRYLADVHEQLS